jgi:hypothetical protein
VSIVVVIPTIREDCAIKWVEQWKTDLKDVRVIVVEDNPVKTFRISGVEHYAWDDIDRDLGKYAWIIPRRTSACRSYGFLKALESDAETIWTLDDDCYPEDALRGSYVRLLEDNFKYPVTTGVVHNGWWNTIEASGLYPRGYPYNIRGRSRPVMLHHGLWSNIPDLDGITQLNNPDFRLPPTQIVDVVPENALFPMCIMNVAFRKEMTAAMYMLLMGQDQAGKRWGFDRFDDIWGGVFMKRIADHLGYSVTSGSPGIHHSRASDAQRNAVLEAPGMMAHEGFWKYIADVKFTGDSVAACYHELGRAVRYSPVAPPKIRDTYWDDLGSAMEIWSDLVKERQ